MSSKASSLASTAAMATFVLVWGSGAIFTRWGLDHSSAFALLILRYGLAFGVLLLIGVRRRNWWPEPGTRVQVAAAGLMLIAGYSVFYFQAMVHGVTPGMLATLLGVQPILTLLMTERRFPLSRLLGLLLALMGLALVVYQSLAQSELSSLGLGFAFASLLCMTFGAMMQKRVKQAPAEVLPLQYLVTLVAYLFFMPFQPFHFELSLDFLIPLVWLGLVTSVGAQLLLYRLIRSGNLVNVTSLLYLVPVVTVMLDYLILGNAMPMPAILGMAGIIAGLILVFKRPAARSA